MTQPQREILRIAQAQSGDREAMDELLRAIQEPLYHYIFGLAGDHHLAIDILQDVFVLIIRKLAWLRDPRVFRPWTYRIASREAFRRLKRERRMTENLESEACLESEPIAPTEDRNAHDLIDQLPVLLQEVSPASRAVLSLHYLREMTLQEVADVLEIPLGTVKARLAYGLSALRKKLSGQPPPTGSAR